MMTMIFLYKQPYVDSGPVRTKPGFSLFC